MERIVDIPSGIKTIKVGLNDPLFTKMLTGFPVREEIIRCRDCKHADIASWRCNHHCFGYYDEQNEIDVIMRSEIRPDGFCTWAEKRES